MSCVFALFRIEITLIYAFNLKWLPRRNGWFTCDHIWIVNTEGVDKSTQFSQHNVTLTSLADRRSEFEFDDYILSLHATRGSFPCLRLSRTISLLIQMNINWNAEKSVNTSGRTMAFNQRGKWARFVGTSSKSIKIIYSIQIRARINGVWRKIWQNVDKSRKTGTTRRKQLAPEMQWTANGRQCLACVLWMRGCYSQIYYLFCHICVFPIVLFLVELAKSDPEEALHGFNLILSSLQRDYRVCCSRICVRCLSNGSQRRRNLNSIHNCTFLYILNHFLCVCFVDFLFEFASSFFGASVLVVRCVPRRPCVCVFICWFESFVCSARVAHFISIRSLCATGWFSCCLNLFSSISYDQLVTSYFLFMNCFDVHLFIFLSSKWTLARVFTWTSIKVLNNHEKLCEKT